MAHSWAWDSKVGINSKQLYTGIENKTVLSSCLSPAEFDVWQYFTAFKCERGRGEERDSRKIPTEIIRNIHTLQPYVHIFALKKNSQRDHASLA